jgi:hypothetical protein
LPHAVPRAATGLVPGLLLPAAPALHIGTVLLTLSGLLTFAALPLLQSIPILLTTLHRLRTRLSWPAALTCLAILSGLPRSAGLSGPQPLQLTP